MPKPKVISVFKTEPFESRFLNVPVIGKPVDFFLECRSYDLEIPVNGKVKKELDIFEETVLRMVQLRKCSLTELADVLCLKTDLVNFILIRLTESGLLCDNQTLSEKGRAVLDAQSKIRAEVETVQGKLFVIKKTGLVLPYIHVGEFQSECVDDFDSSFLTLGYGSAGNYQKVRGKYLRNSDFERRMDSTLDTRVVKRSIQTFNKLASARNLPAIGLCKEYAVLSSLSGNVYFHLQAVVQEGNVDEVMFSDGFVSNIDGVLDYVRQENPELLSEIRSKAVDMTISVSDGELKAYKSQKYSEIYHLYENACQHLPAMPYEDATVDERKGMNEDKRQIIIDCYYMLEWGFYFYTLKNQLSEGMRSLIKQRSCPANARTIAQFAKDIGFFDTDVCRNLFAHLDGNKIDSVYRYRSPKLYICLPLAIAEAKENADSEIHLLIQKNRGALRFIQDLNESCGDLRHDSEADAIDRDTGEILMETVRLLNIMLPDIKLGEKEQGQNKNGNVSQARLLGQVSLEKKLGSVFFSAMSSGLKNEWIKISPDKRGRQLPDAREYVEILYRILQAELSEANSGFAAKHKKTKPDALAIMEQRCSGKIPKSFSKVGEGFYSQSIREEKSTLGAEALVYFANVEDSAVDRLNALHFVTVLDRVISLRGHSNMAALNEDEQSLNQLRDDVIKLSRLFGGYYD